MPIKSQESPQTRDSGQIVPQTLAYQSRACRRTSRGANHPRRATMMKDSPEVTTEDTWIDMGPAGLIRGPVSHSRANAPHASGLLGPGCRCT